MFKKPFSFEGRIRRLEFGLSYLIYIAFTIFLSTIVQETPGLSFIGLGIIPFIWFFLAQGAMRCDDRGNSGWYLLIPFYFLWMLFADGEIGQNDFGPNPKGIGNDDISDDLGKHLIE